MDESPLDPGGRAGSGTGDHREADDRWAERRSHRRHVRIELAAVAVVLAAAIGVVVGYGVSPSPSTTSGETTTSPTSTAPGGGRTSAPGAPSDTGALAAATDPALVDIDVTDAYQAVEGAGTGMVVGSTGEVLTNNHVVEGATTIRVVDVHNGRTYAAAVVGYDPTEDVAVLRLRGASGLPTARMGTASTLQVGDGVVVVGNAEGAGGTPSYAGGSVTAVGQTITAQDQVTGSSASLTGLIETDAEVIPGDSGGALVDDGGLVVGMVTAASESYRLQPSADQGYAIPIDQALAVAAQIEAGRSSGSIHVGPTAFLGVSVVQPLSGIAGAEVAQVVADGAAARSGLVPGDVITSVGGRVVTSPESLTDLLLGASPGASVRVGYVDVQGVQHGTTVTLGTGPAQ